MNDVAAALNFLAGSIHDDGNFSELSCRQADALALVLHLAGHRASAVTVLISHTMGYDEHSAEKEGSHGVITAAYNEKKGAGSKRQRKAARAYLTTFAYAFVTHNARVKRTPA